MSDTKTSDKFFEIDDPKFLITPDAGDVEKRLQKSLIDYKKVTDGYITFEGYVLGSNSEYRKEIIEDSNCLDINCREKLA